MADLHLPGHRTPQLSARSSPKGDSVSSAVTRQTRGADKTMTPVYPQRPPVSRQSAPPSGVRRAARACRRPCSTHEPSHVQVAQHPGPPSPLMRASARIQRHNEAAPREEAHEVRAIRDCSSSDQSLFAVRTRRLQLRGDGRVPMSADLRLERRLRCRHGRHRRRFRKWRSRDRL
jgi:hypothetical protein